MLHCIEPSHTLVIILFRRSLENTSFIFTQSRLNLYLAFPVASDDRFTSAFAALAGQIIVVYWKDFGKASEK